MAKVLIFEKNRVIKEATLIDPTKRVDRDNFKDVMPCTKEVLEVVPGDIIEFCKKTAPRYLCINSRGEWEERQ